MSSTSLNQGELIGNALTILMPLSRWSIDRNPADRTTRIAYSCKGFGAFEVTEALLEDSRDVMTVLTDHAESVYWGTHQRYRSFRDRQRQYEPMLVCGRCKFVMPVPEQERMNSHELFEFSERMSVMWMERADALRREGGW